ncbi:hypothetical protein BDK92_5935 [Micromonospora pisi]|uniref:DUF402 domain-containing protein n=1 Tax=Micromonospora pisi TaxID=589240 RepID=A0A495JRD0_9ACTN|nr:DUF5984 family protein [Micromonospora pisi]RKR91536.1 hypothetical protein BDK92_5935 [Micromonospora pisi]
MLRFHFGLDPLADVPPWGGDQPTLHWFGLTSGWYWIEADRHQLLRYSEQAVRRWDLARPYPHYYVVRLWEDLLVLRWALTEPVPADVVPFVDGTFGMREFPEYDTGVEVDAAFGLQSDYHLDMGYLTDAPHIECWRQTDAGPDLVTISQRVPPGDQGTFVGPELLTISVPTADFFAAVHDFDRQLIAAMDERITELERTGPPAGVELDLDALRAEHVNRSRWLAERLAAPRQVDWDQIRSGIAEISTWPLLGARS